MLPIKELVETMAYDDEARQEFVKRLGKRISEERLKQKIGAGDFAQRCGISYSCLRNAENGQSNITITHLIIICLALDIKLEDLVTPELYSPHYSTQPNKDKPEKKE